MTWLTQALDHPIGWERLASTFPHPAAMAACPQDWIHHGEGDVWTHTRRVVEALHCDRDYPCLPPSRQRVLNLAALLHDIAKPLTTREEWDASENRMRIRQPGHARLGARMAWQELAREGFERSERLAVYWLIAWHIKPFHLWNEPDMERRAIIFSLVGNWHELLMLARADNRGRLSPNVAATEEQFALLTLWLEEQGLLRSAYAFADDASRREYLEKPGRSPHYAAQPPRGSRVIVLAGLPGAGKDSYARATFPQIPIVSLDAIRERMEVEPEDDQGRVIQAALERAREHLRAKRDFIWNATNITISRREKIIGLARAYDAHVAIHAIDTPLATILRQNRQRERIVPQRVIENLAGKWEPPSVLEAHEVVWV
ncbi:MAG: AAA family ATPase [Alphaproteobacteria bacterium]|nr:AAA family ATPase [Alphaproteobacteria bacterium]